MGMKCLGLSSLVLVREPKRNALKMASGHSCKTHPDRHIWQVAWGMAQDNSKPGNGHTQKVIPFSQNHKIITLEGALQTL